MYMLQLFDASDEAKPIDARLVRDGIVRIGRDSAADWPIADPDCELSRAHCEIGVTGDALTMRALGANGVFDDETGSRFPDAVIVTVPVPAKLRFGRFRLRAFCAPTEEDGQDLNRTLVMTPPLGTSSTIPDDWADSEALPVTAHGSLLDAFCEGAGLDASLLSSEDPTEVMRRAGAVYRQMVLGIGDLMAERNRARGHYKMSRTTIGGRNNNPFKWAPTQRLAIDLLLVGSKSFLPGPEALQASFRDIKRHLIATFAGLQASLRAAVGSFDPKSVDQAIAGKTGLLKSRAAAQLEEMANRHADLAQQLSEAASGSLERAFIAAYDEADFAADRQERSA